MNLAEMLEKLRKEALADPGLRERLLDTRKEKVPAQAPPAAFAGSWAIRSMRWISSRKGRNFMPPCAGALTAAEKIPRCWKERMIFMNFSLPVLLLKIPGLDR